MAKIPQRHIYIKTYVRFQENKFILNTPKKFVDYNFFLPRKIFFKKFSYVLESLFFLNENIVFFDKDFNFNYLPFNYKVIFSRSPALLRKTLKFFNVNSIIFLNTGGKENFFKKFNNFNLLKVSSSRSRSNYIDIDLSLPNTTVNNYILYIFVLNTYLYFK